MSRKKTHEEYVKEVSIINPNIEVVDKYINASTKITHRCKKDNYVWLVSPNKILSGKGCPKCAGNNRKTKEEYINELLSKNPTIELIGDYIGANNKTTHYCMKHNIYWDARPSDVLRGSGCKMCKNEKIGLSNCKSEIEYIKEVKKINPYIKVLEPYVNSFTPILHECTIHNIQWKIQPRSILNGSGCYKCGVEKLKTIKQKSNEQYLCELKNINSNIVPIETYINSNVSILHKCLVDDYEWYAKPANILSGKGCPKCAGNIKKTHDEYLYQLFIVNSNIEVLGQYINAYTPILHRCKIDGNIWSARPSDILSGKGCPRCSVSKGEKQICLWLDKNNIIYEHQKYFKGCKDIKPLPFDFYLPDYNITIEYDGKQHFEPIEHFGGQDAFELQVKHDNIKNEYCKNNGISLLRIPYFKNVEEELNNFLFI